MRWDQLAATQKSVAVKTLAIWFILTPILAKIIESDFLKSLAAVQLPFSWQLFYVAALAFFVATLIYQLSCPEIIKNYDGWSDYEHKEGSYEKLIPLIIEVLNLLSPEARQAFMRRQSELRHIVFHDPDHKPVPIATELWSRMLLDYERSLRGSRANNDRLSDIFSATRDLAQQTRPFPRGAITLIHSIGFIALLFVLCQNAYSVLRTFPSPLSLLQNKG